MKITQSQRGSLALLAVLFLVDNLITLYGVFFWSGTFYEANPLLGYFLKISPWVFAGVITLAKLSFLALLAGMIHYCNSTEKNGQMIGTVVANYPLGLMSGALTVMSYTNIVNVW